ncbi:MAG: hypothetical protein ACI9NY_001451 [Kiritimatiellia bacterium]|jgi:hypothetical protein
MFVGRPLTTHSILSRIIPPDVQPKLRTQYISNLVQQEYLSNANYLGNGRRRLDWYPHGSAIIGNKSSGYCIRQSVQCL